MSRVYRMDVRIDFKGMTPKVLESIQKVLAKEEPDLDYVDMTGGRGKNQYGFHTFCGDLALCAGQSDEEWATELVEKIRMAAGKAGPKLTIDVTAYYMEDVPREDYHYGPGQTMPDGETN